MRTVLIHNRITMDAVAVPEGLALDPGFASLATLSPGMHGCVLAVGSGAAELSALERRLLEFGFVSGEHVEVVAEARPGRDPFVVRVGQTTLALRRREAQSVWVQLRPARANAPASAGAAARAPVATTPQVATSP
jgi:ferrous iron transport protein A